MIRWRFFEPNPARDLLEQVLQAAGQPHHPRDHGILTIRIPKQKPKAPERINIQVNRSGARATIEATKGQTYSEIKQTPKVAASKASLKAAPKPGSSKKPSGGGAGARRPASGS